MFKKWQSDTESGVVQDNGEKTVESHDPPTPKRTNSIIKGSKLIGDINITSDLEMSGDVEGSIRSLQDSNIILKGNCKGSIETKEGSVSLEGSLEGGNIIAGKEVRIIGKFNGEAVRAKDKIYIDGEFNGKLEANEIEIGSNAIGKGELHYKDFISIARGAKINVQIGQSQPELKLVDKSHEKDAPKPSAEKAELKAAK